MANSRFASFLPFLSWFRLLDRPTIATDIAAGITAGVLILPQAVALAAIAGLPPEYGIYTSIFPVIIAALFGSSFHVMSGPNTALVVLIFLDLSTFASRGTEDYITYAMGLTFMAGVFQLLFGFARLGVVFNYISHSVIVGLTAGVGVVIIIQQLGNFFGILLNQREEIYETLLQAAYNLDHANWAAAACGLVTIVTGLIARSIPKLRKAYLILAIVVGTLFACVLNALFGSAYLRIDKLGTLTLSAFPFRLVDFSSDSLIVYADLALSACLIGFLGLMQSAVIARSMAAKSGQHVNMNQEIVSQGLANVVGSYLSCFASCGSFNRSAANFDAGAKTPLASLVSAVALAALIWFAADLIALMPISVMAGLLMLVGWGLIDRKEIAQLVNVRSEFVIFAACFFAAVVLGLDYGVVIGVVLSLGVYLRNISKPVFQSLNADARVHYLPVAHKQDVTVLRIIGTLFFGSVQAIDAEFRRLATEEGRERMLFLSLEHVAHLDSSCAQSLVKEANRRIQAGGELSIGLRDHAFDDVLENAGLFELLDTAHIHYRLTADRRAASRGSAEPRPAPRDPSPETP